MDNWNNSTNWQQQHWRAGQGPANEFASAGARRDYRPPGDAYAAGRGSRGRHRGGPPPRGAFPGRRGRGRPPPAPFSVDAEEFVPRSRLRGEADGTNWEDAPEFIPAARQQQGSESTPDEPAGGATLPAEGDICTNGVISDSGFMSSSNNNNNNNNNNNKADGDSERGGDGDGELAPGHTPFGRGGKRRADVQWRGSARGRGRGGGGRGGWQPQQRRPPAGADDARNRNWREPAPAPAPAPAPELGRPQSPGHQPASDAPMTNGEGADVTYGRGGRAQERERQWKGGGGGDRPRQVGSGRFPDSSGRRGPDGGRYSDWQPGEAGRDRDRGRTAREGGGGSGPVERRAENGEAEVRRDAADGRRKTTPARHGRADAKMWRGVDGGNSKDRTEQPDGGGREAAEAAATRGTVPADRRGEEESRSRKWQPPESGVGSPAGCGAQQQPQPPRGEEGAPDSGHRERLSVQLSRGTLECLVCCERVRPRDAVWSCAACHHVLHLGCSRRWARSSKADSGGWPCPACRHEVPRVPTEYRCWCGKRRDPEWSPFEVPHGCGEMCGKPRGGASPSGEHPGGESGGNGSGSGGDGCTHRCTLLCHPGPCPPCAVQVNRSCGCGQESRLVVCGQVVACGATCGRALSCERHRCERPCHPGPCGECQLVEATVCWCGKATREVPCDSDGARAGGFACGEVCGRALACGNHRCGAACHEGPCAPCSLSPDVVRRCPCGKVALHDLQGAPQQEAGSATPATAESGGTSDPTQPGPEGTGEPPPDTDAGGEDCEKKVAAGAGSARTSCLDPVPTCGQVCGKPLPCGQPSQPHECAALCHAGPCPPCPLVTSVKCRCGSLDKELPCCELTTRADDARCSRRCTKKRACGKHKCGQECCIEQEHACPLVCNHALGCGRHRCEALCHRGNCPPCLQSSFDELTCECGAQVIEPPVPCGTRRPACDRPCPREHACGHAPLHTCHSEPACPPCTVLVQRHCYGGHELRKAVPCHQTELSCGRPCGKDLSCGRHTCAVACHAGPCPPACTQPCTRQRQLCGHPCAAPCHDGPCPDTPCREMVVVTCECGHRSTTRPCAENVNEYRRIAMSLLAAKMTDVRAGRTVDLTDLAGTPRGISLKTLDCNDECKIVERSRRLAIALQIRNPDLSAKLTPRYSDYMRQWAKKDPAFCAAVHDKLTELVKLAKESKQKSRSYSFDPMNREKRHFVHEYCEHFGCESVAYDQEPKRNVVATASRDKAWLPSMSLLEVMQRESGQRKIPKPVLSSGGRAPPAARPMEVLSASSSQPPPDRESSSSSSSWVTTVGAPAAPQPRQQSECGGES